MDNLTKEDCTLFAPWKASSNGCCDDGTPHPGYSIASPPVSVCVEGRLMLACSLTAEPNIYHPSVGTEMSPPTWEMKSLHQHICQKVEEGVKDKQDQLKGSDGANLPGGACVPTCTELDAITPSIGTNGNWFIGTADTGIKAEGQDGNSGTNGVDGETPYIGTNGNWFVGTTDTGVQAQGPAGQDGEDGTGGGGGLTSVVTDGTLTGDGTATNPLSVVSSGGGSGDASATDAWEISGDCTNGFTFTSADGSETCGPYLFGSGSGGVTALTGCLVAEGADCPGLVPDNSRLYALCHNPTAASCDGGSGSNFVGPLRNHAARIA